MIIFKKFLNLYLELTWSSIFLANLKSTLNAFLRSEVEVDFNLHFALFLLYGKTLYRRISLALLVELSVSRLVSISLFILLFRCQFSLLDILTFISRFFICLFFSLIFVIWWAIQKLALRNGFCCLYRLCTTTPEVKFESIASTVMNLELKIRLHQGSVLSPLLFTIALEALSHEFCTGTLWKLLNADDPMIIAETENDLRMKLIKWKTNLEAQGLRVNMRRTKTTVSKIEVQILKDSGKYPFSVYRKVAGSNSIYCTGSLCWIHKKCTGIIGRLKPNPDYCCSRCKSVVFAIDGRLNNK